MLLPVGIRIFWSLNCLNLITCGGNIRTAYLQVQWRSNVEAGGHTGNKSMHKEDAPAADEQVGTTPSITVD